MRRKETERYLLRVSTVGAYGNNTVENYKKLTQIFSFQ